MKPLTIIIPCAGKGTRSELNYPKTFYKYDGKTILEAIILKCLLTAKQLQAELSIIIVIHDSEDKFKKLLDTIQGDFYYKFVYQNELLGTAHAVELALDGFIDQDINDQLIGLIWGDCLGFKAETLTKILSETQGEIVVPGFYSNRCYTCFNVESNGQIKSCYETKGFDTQPNGYTDIGIFAFKARVLRKYLRDEVRVANDNGTESSFIGTLSMAANLEKCLFLDIANPSEKQGFNSKNDLDMGVEID